jgi:hemolysin type calcium-binding protein/calcineurin-like phosphoesterase family protein
MPVKPLIAFALSFLLLAVSPARAADPLIAAAGDIADSCSAGSPPAGAMGTSNLLTAQGVTTVLPLGDLQYEHGELVNFQNCYDPTWGRVKAISRPAIGNHEQSGAGYFEYFNGPGAAVGPAGPTGSGYYGFDAGAWHLIALNSNCDRVGGCHTGSPQERWLEQDLAANPTTCTLAYWHHPVFSSTRPGTDAKPLWQALYVAGADIVLTGHAHNYERFAPQAPDGAYDPAAGITGFVAGTGGKSHHQFGSSVVKNSELRLDSTFGVLVLALHPSSYDWKFVTDAGQVADTGWRGCHGPPPAAPDNPSAPLGECTIVGTREDDVLVGTSRRDIICGLRGDDEIRSGRGDDVIAGGPGEDRVIAGRGDDRVYGESGIDHLYGGRGRDRVFGASGADRLSGGSGNDRLSDGGGNDRVFGGAGNDVMLPGGGHDLLVGGSGRDRAATGRHDRTRGVERR